MAIPHNSKCRYGERGAADAVKAQIIPMLQRRVPPVAKVISELKGRGSGRRGEGLLPLKADAGTATRHREHSATQMPCRSCRSVG